MTDVTQQQVGVAANFQTRVPSYYVQISAGTPAILTEVFCGFPQSLRMNAGEVSQLYHEYFLPNPFQFIITLPHHSALIGRGLSDS
jgi:Mlc titration factor MtfA (ptsG expression regulator)